MKDLIDRQAAIEAINRYGSVWMEYTEAMSIDEIAERALKACKQSMTKILHDLPSAQPERKVFEEMSDTEFEKWLYEHGICNPDIHELISCDVVPSLIDYAINELPPTQPRWIPVTERLPVEGDSVLLCNSYGDITLGRLVRTNEGCNWDIYAWWCDIDDWVAWMSLPEPYRKGEENE